MHRHRLIATQMTLIRDHVLSTAVIKYSVTLSFLKVCVVNHHYKMTTFRGNTHVVFPQKVIIKP